MSIEKIVYLAGIIDGEGCVKPSKSNYPRCIVSNTSKELVDWLYDNFGGYKSPSKREGNRKLQYWWMLRKKEMKNILPLIIPYLIIKKEEAKQSLRLAQKEYPNPFLGRKHTKKSKRKMTKALKKIWKDRKLMNLKK
ncbi:MAG: hypothetical protein ACKKMS_00205 [Candidatus Nealsonbacteria bacterium]